MNKFRTWMPDFLDENEWKSPHVYCCDYEPLPNGPGVYLIVGDHHPFIDKKPSEIVYVGGSSNISRRIETHNIIKFVSEKYHGYRVFFKPTADYIKIERHIIRSILPRFNSHKYIDRRNLK